MQISRVKSSGSSQAEVQELCKPPVSSPPEGAQQEHKPTVLGPAKKKEKIVNEEIYFKLQNQGVSVCRLFTNEKGFRCLT